jgi:hypothetical protein
MSVIDRIRARHDRMSSGEARPFADVPEWGDETGPLRVYWRPVTGRDMASVKQGGPRTNAEIVALKAEGADGKRMFPDLDDIHTLYATADAAVLLRLALAMMQVPSIQDAAKN